MASRVRRVGHGGSNGLVEVGGGERFIPVHERVRIIDERGDASGSQQCADRPAGTDEVAMGDGCGRTGKAHPARLDNQVRRGIGHQVLARGPAAGDIPLGDPKPANEFRAARRRFYPGEVGERCGIQHATGVVHHSLRVVA